jgi:ubiquinone/menaquinone biosynthesis C-methylase UbiE
MNKSVYDERPFDWVDLSAASDTYPTLFRSFLGSLGPGSQRCEIGCGAGRNLMGIREGAGLAVGVDISFVSARRASAVAPTAQANALRLPFRDGSFDAVVIDGVAHHTPDPRRAIQEAIRITRPGGLVYVAVYKRRTLYAFLYRWVGAILRAFSPSALGRVMNDVLALQVYRRIHYWKREEWRSDEAMRNLYSDYFLTPIASFHSREEVVSWIESAGARVRTTDEFPEGNCRLVIAEREQG